MFPDRTITQPIITSSHKTIATSIMMTIKNNSTKRKRIIRYEGTTKSGVNRLNDLPPLVLEVIADFLPKTSQALLVAAFLDPPLSSIASRAIESLALDRECALSNNWETLDFEDISEGVAERLTDEDLAGILICIDAVHSLKELELTHCIKVVGHGLEPLRGSLVIEMIDLSLVELHQDPDIQNGSISMSVVVPILQSIIDRDGNSLNHLQLAKKWRVEQGAVLSLFLSKYSQLLDDRESECSYDHHDDGEEVWETPWVEVNGNYYGIQKHTCYECTNNVCESEIHHWVRRSCRFV
jgi:hypothetical protein|mmetsp:Transcript_22032/g.47813  ORF Transcript_22032/g.47813 Transcript_22032/m.47813 type:complete len:296 (+) Transcript_22032:658-1545(+)